MTQGKKPTFEKDFLRKAWAKSLRLAGQGKLPRCLTAACGDVNVTLSKAKGLPPSNLRNGFAEIATLAALARGDVNVTLSEAKGLPPPNLRNGFAEIATLAALARGDVNVTLSEAKGLPPSNLRNGFAETAALRSLAMSGRASATLAPHCVRCSAGGHLPPCPRNNLAGDRRFPRQHRRPDNFVNPSAARSGLPAL
ncbi:hypothetical protein AC812_09500 [Bellilinea caldifistulae]|uniref:Uncharacterized protein n=1 Tax=Bellilinea caldifistulae TaxID=360411 RepID=A0A0P6X2G2_9CHLR|nr:hypothetical protein AC812_09500 [Bellilinea caldifistulae]